MRFTAEDAEGRVEKSSTTGVPRLVHRNLVGLSISVTLSAAKDLCIKDGRGAGGRVPRRECAEVDFVPGEKSEREDTQPLRPVAVHLSFRPQTKPALEDSPGLYRPHGHLQR